ncbi:hypothetical protein [Tautonia plasticadhaerens]|uniref:Uncharacterized protein n=1 Tax=Tautonia plasticadhaerens TaxID=2527974 RepID=A0A518HEW6_9BACT|nr:hypothetical protein [Tautonia plasticadhaerens]QDV39316.1 hypothetical protein ElP_72800 [Tautonia plasticadhaerens]
MTKKDYERAVENYREVLSLCDCLAKKGTELDWERGKIIQIYHYENSIKSSLATAEACLADPEHLEKNNYERIKDEMRVPDTWLQ